MKFAIVLTVAALMVCSGFAAPQEDKYTTKYDNVDIDQILKNERLFNNYVQCLLTDKGCTPDASELKKVLPDALKNECAKCNETQKEKSDKVFRYVYNNKKDVFDSLAAKFDPEGEYKGKYSKYAEERGITL